MIIHRPVFYWKSGLLRLLRVINDYLLTVSAMIRGAGWIKKVIDGQNHIGLIFNIQSAFVFMVVKSTLLLRFILYL